MFNDKLIFTKCCGCVHLRVCLQIYAWIKVAADTSTSIIIVLGLVFFNYQHPENLSSLSYNHFYMVLVIMLVVDLFFVTILISGLCSKNVSSLRMFYYYGMYLILAEATLIFTVIVLSLSHNAIQWWSLMLLTVFLLAGIIWICIDIAAILAVQSEIIKIENNEQYDFSKLSVRQMFGENGSEDEHCIETYNIIEQELK